VRPHATRSPQLFSNMSPLAPQYGPGP